MAKGFTVKAKPPAAKKEERITIERGDEERNEEKRNTIGHDE